MTLKDFAKKLRHAADLLDELGGVMPHLNGAEAPEKAKRLLTDVKQNKYGTLGKYQGRHWTQLHKNKAKLHAMIMRNAKKRMKNIRAQRKGVTSVGVKS